MNFISLVFISFFLLFNFQMFRVRNNAARRWNHCVERLKIKEIVLYQCEASCLISGNRCKKLSKFRYCKNHHKILKQFCKTYHLVGLADNPKYSGISLETLALVEYIMRMKYKLMFNIEDDYGHLKWARYLKTLISKHDLKYIKQFEIYSNKNNSSYNIINNLDKTNLDKRNLEYLDLEETNNLKTNNLKKNSNLDYRYYPSFKKATKFDMLNDYFYTNYTVFSYRDFLKKIEYLTLDNKL